MPNSTKAGVHTPTLVLVQDEEWPWDIEGLLDGKHVFLVRRAYHSTSQKTISDVMAGKHMGENHDAAVTANKTQWEQLERMASCVNNHAALCEALHNMIALAGHYFTDEPQKLALAQARSALAAAEGGV